jgi:hypothetical protein
VTSSKWPNDANPEFLPFANNVDATNRYDCLLANLSPTEVPRRDERDVELEKYGVTTIAASPATGAGSGAGAATGTGLISIVPKTFMLLFCHSSYAST